MNFEYSEKEEKFRTEVRDWLKETLPKYLSEKVRKYQRLTKEDYELNEPNRLSDNRFTRTFNVICGTNFKTR